MNINIEEFKTNFIDVNFDEILLQYNNPLINSNVYTNVKQKYFDETFYNYREYKMHLMELDVIVTNKEVKKSETKIIYNFTNVELENELKSKLKKILIRQRNAKSNFMNYINHLNNNVRVYIDSEKEKGKQIKSKPRSFFSKFMDTKSNMKKRVKKPTSSSG
jgi:hypothetical protein